MNESGIAIKFVQSRKHVCGPILFPTYFYHAFEIEGADRWLGKGANDRHSFLEWIKDTIDQIDRQKPFVCERRSQWLQVL